MIGRSSSRSFSGMMGRLNFFDATTFASVAQISDLGDYAGDITFSADGQWPSSAVPATRIRATAASASWTSCPTAYFAQTSVPLADNIATSGNDEFFVSAGKDELYPRYGVDVYALEPSGNLIRTKTYFLGINRYQQSSQRVVCTTRFAGSSSSPSCFCTSIEMEKPVWWVAGASWVSGS